MAEEIEMSAEENVDDEEITMAKKYSKSVIQEYSGQGRDRVLQTLSLHKLCQIPVETPNLHSHLQQNHKEQYKELKKKKKEKPNVCSRKNTNVK